MSEKDIKKSKAKCPKCRSDNLLILEKSIHYQEWEQIDGMIDKAEGYMNSGDVIGTWGKCKNCEHSWRFKSLQITGLFI